MVAQSLKGKVAVITGAGSGIGRAAALLLAEQGAAIATIDQTREHSEETIDHVHQNGGNGMVTVADIAQPDQVQQSFQQIANAFGRIDIVFANAGINGVWAPIEKLTAEEWDKTLDTNLKGTFLTTKYAVPYLKKQGGSVVITSSVNGTRIFSNTGATAYATSKAAQVAFTKMVALELAPHRVRVNVICPGAIMTGINESTTRRDLEQIQTPVEFPKGKIPLTDGQPGTSEQVAQLVLFLASDASSHISGTEIWIDGTESLLKG
ncbi:SDR family oxidoreductase [Stenomitos frigidus]|uniref:3-oxoacyl-[acyl-carrier-protein] reductase n=1 Tax=Stenomitos frigidus ULC18 TaxID=2107698 RepID=A0A2T1DTU2_9CYAN|nr:SDR family NAD(P)-dependent oxidoreductase [Stenomitos frigidus]PSB23917.1 3-oxoacyl-[acyl-carrier-protein] reductase [Stenomitos frigidus ULC18]